MSHNVNAVAILGGTFNPIHRGHCCLAESLQNSFKLNAVRLLPCALPAHRQPPRVSTEQRSQMIKLAISNSPGLQFDATELALFAHNQQPSFTVESLQAIRQQLEQCSDRPVYLYFAMGSDAFATFESWHRWQDILQLANIIVLDRPHYPLQQIIAQPEKSWLRAQQQQFHFTDHESPSGQVYAARLSYLAISSSEIRDRIQQGLDVSSDLPAPVYDYIVENGLYQTE